MSLSQWQKADVVQSIIAALDSKQGKGGKGTPAVWDKANKGTKGNKGFKGNKADKGSGKGTKGGKGGPKGGKTPADAPGTHPPCRVCGLTNHLKVNCLHKFKIW